MLHAAEQGVLADEVPRWAIMAVPLALNAHLAHIGGAAALNEVLAATPAGPSWLG